VHAKLEPGLHWNWLVSNVFTIMLPTLVVGWLLSLFRDGPQSRLVEFSYSGAIATVCLLVATMASPTLRPAALRAARAWLP
jgi:hypothetical protein